MIVVCITNETGNGPSVFSSVILGDVCEHDVDECQLHPCRNNGSCVNYVGTYRCDCLTGFRGNDCSLDIDECDRFPCKNEGTCTNYPGGYSCQCHDGFEGH